LSFFFLRGILTEGDGSQGQLLLTYHVVFALRKGSQSKTVPNKIVPCLSSSDIFICKFPRQLCALSKISACIQ